jgi:hypothetical protein
VALQANVPTGLSSIVSIENIASALETLARRPAPVA